jgi:hypothetical protein
MTISKPIHVGISYAVFIALGILACIWFVGKKPVLSRASKSKPYAVLLQERFHESPLWEQDATTIICFGDSNCTRIWGMFHEAIEEQDMEGEVRIGDWAYPGADMFDYYCLLHRARKFSPDLVIIPINWRSFGRAWIRQTRFPELSAFIPFGEEFLPEYENPLASQNISPLQHLKNKMLLFQIYPLGIKIWARESLKGAFPELGKSEEERIVAGARSVKYRTRGRGFSRNVNEYKSRFPMKLKEEYPMVRTLRSLAYSASQGETKVLFFIWPLDQELLGELGLLNKDELEQSRRLLLEASKANTAENIYFLDLSDFLEHRYFKDSGGHCTPSGRKRIATALAEKVPEILSQNPAIMSNGEPPTNNAGAGFARKR